MPHPFDPWINLADQPPTSDTQTPPGTSGPGREAQRYELVERIAKGGMAEVFRAKTYGPHGFERELAVKRILPELASSQEFVDRFIREAQIAVTLRHDNIVQVTDFRRYGESLYIAMEFIDGLDLRSLLQRAVETGVQMPLAAGAHIGLGVLQGLEFAHGREVVHRDISPANILISRLGEVKITDFGIAQASGQGSGYTQEFRIMGKWRYLSPEQSLGQGLSDRSDVFSAAALLFEVFTGQKLYPYRSPEEIVRSIRSEGWLPAIHRHISIPPGLETIFPLALARDPNKRISAAEFSARLFDWSKAHGLTIHAIELSRFIKDLEIQPKLDSSSNLVPIPQTGSPNPIDDIINSELAFLGGGARTSQTRITASGEAFPIESTGISLDEPTSVEGAYEAGADLSGTAFTFVDGGIDSTGMASWLLQPMPQESPNNSQRQATYSRAEAQPLAQATYHQDTSTAEFPLPPPELNALPLPGSPEATQGQPWSRPPDTRSIVLSAISASPENTTAENRTNPAQRRTKKGLWFGAIAIGVLLLFLAFLTLKSKTNENPKRAAATAELEAVPSPNQKANIARDSVVRINRNRPQAKAQDAAPSSNNQEADASTKDAKGDAALVASDDIEVISTPPGAEIWIGQEATGLVTPSTLSRKRIGSEALELYLAEYEPCSGKLNEMKSEFRCELDRKTVVLTIESDPSSAEVSLDGQVLGVSPLQTTLPWAKSYSLRLRLQGHDNYKSTLHTKGKTLLHKAKLRTKAVMGSVDIFAKPWAHLYLGGRKLGEAPVRGLRLKEGTHKIRLHNPVLGKEKFVRIKVPSSKPYSFNW